MSSEAAVQQAVMEEFCRLGGTPWRNNSGACTDETGRLIRYGLANTSKQLNDKIKSSDIIGIFPIQAYTQTRGWYMIGCLAAIECKPTGWRMTPGDKRAIAQERFINIVLSNGGFAGFATCVEDLWRILGLTI